MFRSAHQCVVCGFPSKKGSICNGKFVCKACENEQIEDDSDRYEEEVYAEIDRLSYHKELYY